MSKQTGGKVIGQGTYGCVHKPQMECKRSQPTADAVSKLMSMSNATSELSEFAEIASADRKQTMHLGTPTICNIADTDANRQAAKDCENDKFDSTTLDKYALLVMKDGGQNLQQFADDVYANWATTPANTKKIELFWLEVSRLFYGLKVFHDHGLVHHDLKPQNVVYNQTTNRLNFIDFGFITRKVDVMNMAKSSQYWSTVPHWSFPWENPYLNKTAYTTLVDKNAKNNTKFYADLVKNIWSRYGVFFAHVMPVGTSDSWTKSATDMINSYIAMITECEHANYNAFLEKSVDTTDSYGIGMALLYVLNRSGKFMDDDLFVKLGALFINMITPAVNVRLDVNNLALQYETIMRESGLLTKHGKQYTNNLLVDGAQISALILKLTEKIVLTDNSPTQSQLTDEALSFSPICPTGKEYKSSTKRCVKQCKPGYKRSVKFRCVKDAQTADYPPCPAGKERNPFTRRCVKRCKSGFLRDTTYKCRRAGNPFDD